MRELHSALGDCWEGSFEVKKNPIPCRLSLIGKFYQKSVQNSLSKILRPKFIVQNSSLFITFNFGAGPDLNRLKLGLFDEILTAGDQKRLGGCMNGLNKLSIKHRLTFNHKLANSMSEKAKQGRFMKSAL